MANVKVAVDHDDADIPLDAVHQRFGVGIGDGVITAEDNRGHTILINLGHDLFDPLMRPQHFSLKDVDIAKIGDREILRQVDIDTRLINV